MNCPNCKVVLLEREVGTPNERVECSQCGFNTPLNNRKPINEFYCWLSVDKDGKEGMVAFKRNGVHLVAVHSEKSMTEKMIPDMQIAAKATGMKMRLAKFVKHSIEYEI